MNSGAVEHVWWWRRWWVVTIDNNQKIGLFSTDKTIFKALYKIRCKDKVIFNRLGFFQSLKITQSLENSPKSQEVTGHRNQKIASTHRCKLPLTSQVWHSAPTCRPPSPSPLPLSDHSKQEHKSRWRTITTIFYQVLYSCSPSVNVVWQGILFISYVKVNFGIDINAIQ